MPRDKKIKNFFEIADDGMQGVYGYFMYGIACKNASNKSKVIEKLPSKQFPITHEWVRYYDPLQLYEEMTVYFDVYHARVSLISIIGIFEGALENFNKRLVEAQKIPQSNVSYKGRLEWAFDIASRSKYGNSDMQDRISDICMDVDNARRIRNLWMHNNGLFNERYGIDAIQVKGCRPLINPDFMKFKRDRRKRVPIILGIDEFRSIYKSHVELLHHLHDTIQREHFAQKRSYGYKELKKPIVWHRLLIGK